MKAVTRLADILIVAIGKPEFVTGDMIKPGAVVIDVGVNRVEDPSTKQGYAWWATCSSRKRDRWLGRSPRCREGSGR